MSEKELEGVAVDLINRLLTVIEEQKKIILKYEGAIEGVKLFLEEMKKKLPKEEKEV